MVLSLDRWVGKTAIVTGASAGIGAAIAELLVKKGINVVGLARRSEKIEAQAKTLAGAKGKLYAVKTDMTKEADILAAFKWTKENVGPVHILINNAGLLLATELIDGDTQKWKNTIDVNILGLCIATREAVAQMKENKIDGQIVHINSVAGHEVKDFPGSNVYAATKHAVTALTETLRLELNRIQSKIKITSVSPGAVATEFVEASGLNAANPGLKDMFDKMPWLQSEDVADAVVYVLSTPPHVQIHELMIKPVNEAF